MKKHFWYARLLGKVFLVSGIFLSIYGLAESSSLMTQWSLALIAAGIVAMAISFYHGLKSRGPDRGPSGWKGPGQGTPR